MRQANQENREWFVMLAVFVLGACTGFVSTLAYFESRDEHLQTVVKEQGRLLEHYRSRELSPSRN